MVRPIKPWPRVGPANPKNPTDEELLAQAERLEDYVYYSSDTVRASCAEEARRARSWVVLRRTMEIARISDAGRQLNEIAQDLDVAAAAACDPHHPQSREDVAAIDTAIREHLRGTMNIRYGPMSKIYNHINTAEKALGALTTVVGLDLTTVAVALRANVADSDDTSWNNKLNHIRHRSPALCEQHAPTQNDDDDTEPNVAPLTPNDDDDGDGDTEPDIRPARDESNVSTEHLGSYRTAPTLDGRSASEQLRVEHCCKGCQSVFVVTAWESEKEDGAPFISVCITSPDETAEMRAQQEQVSTSWRGRWLKRVLTLLVYTGGLGIVGALGALLLGADDVARAAISIGSTCLLVAVAAMIIIAIAVAIAER